MDLDIVRKMFTGMGKFAGIVNPLPYILNAMIPNVADNALGEGAFDSVRGKYLGMNLTGAEKEYAKLNYDNQLNFLRDAPQAQVEGAEKAGVNPAFALTGGHPVTPSNTAGFSSGGSLSDLVALATLPAQLKMIKSQRDLADANADKAKADANLANSASVKNVEDAESMRISNEFMRQTFEARKESIEAQNSLTRSKAIEVYKNMDVADANIKRLIEESKTEESKRALLKAQEILANANASQIYSLLPYRKLLMEAETSRERASATLAMVQSAYQSKLISSGYIDAMCSEMLAQARASNAQANMSEIEGQIRELKNKLLHGDLFDNNFETGFAPLDFISNNINALGNDFVTALALISENFPKIM